MSKTFITHSYEETILLAKKLANYFPNGSVITLTGDLGTGKTTFVRGLAKALNINEVIQSPTFNIMKNYFKGTRPLIHIDAYRLADTNSDIGLDEYIGYKTGLTVVEWPEFIKELIPNNCFKVNIHSLSGNNREITVEGVEF